MKTHLLWGQKVKG